MPTGRPRLNKHTALDDQLRSLNKILIETSERNSHLVSIETLAFASLRHASSRKVLWRQVRPSQRRMSMRGRAMMILASAVLAGSLLATGAQARGGGGSVSVANLVTKAR